MPITTDDDQPRIEGTQVTVADVVSLADYGYTPHEIADQKDVSVDEVKEALDYVESTSTAPSDSAERASRNADDTS